MPHRLPQPSTRRRAAWIPAAALASFLLAPAAPLPAAASAPAEQDPPPKRPNIVFVYADDHAERAVGASGSPLTRTPNIDRLADEGVRFRQSFVANSICGPARATILTGLHSHANGKTTNGGGFRDELPSFAKALQASGYRTAMVGKWHLSTTPNGFDHWAIARGGYYNLALETADGRERHQGYAPEIITDEGLRWVEQGRGQDQPFFLWLSHTATHRTWMPGPRYLGRYAGVRIPEPASLFDDYAGRSPGAAAAQMRISRDLFPAYDLKLPVTGDGILDGSAAGKLKGMSPAQRSAWDAAYGPENAAYLSDPPVGEARTRWNYQRYIQDYLRCVDALDDSLGAVLAYLERTGLDQDTIVIYSSDQGFFLGEHGWYDKRWMYEPSLRTPLIVRWPGVTAAGAVREELVQNIDMAPTFLAMAGVDEPGPMHGRSLAPLLRGQTPTDWRSAIYYHYQQRDSGRTNHTVAPHNGVRTDRWKLIHVYEHGFWELYDLEADPEEMVNLAGDPTYAEVEAGLRRRLRELQEQFEDHTAPAF